METDVVMSITVEDKKSIKSFINSLSEYKKHHFDEAVKLCLPQSPFHRPFIQKDIIWLTSVGNNVLTAKPKKSEIAEQLEKIGTLAKDLSGNLERSHIKTLFLLDRENAFGGRPDMTQPVTEEFRYVDVAMNLINQIKNLSVSAEYAIKKNKAYKKTDWISIGLSEQDEMVSFCLWIFKKYRPKIAKKDEGNDFHKFCQEIFGLVQGKERSKSLMGSVRKALR